METWSVPTYVLAPSVRASSMTTVGMVKLLGRLDYWDQVGIGLG